VAVVFVVCRLSSGARARGDLDRPSPSPAKEESYLAALRDKLLAPLSAADRTQLIGLLTRLLEHDAPP